jgi:Right handed beta helix region
MTMKFAATISRIALMSLATLALAAASSLASAQATRTWVSGVGDDANPCSRTAPCKTWAGAISKTMAGGEIDALDPGGFGAVTITKAVTLDGSPGSIAGILVSAGNGINVSAAATDKVIIRNMTFEGEGTSTSGISVVTAAHVSIDNVTIYGFATGINVAPTTNATSVYVERSRIYDNTTGISVNGAGAAAVLRLSDTAVQNNGTGLATSGGGSITSFNNNRLNGNTTDGAPTQTIYLR